MVKKAYPPKWCKSNDCKKCDLRACNNKALELLLPYHDIYTPFNKKGGFEITSLAVYMGFCPKLSKNFYEFPNITPIPIVYSNFINSQTRFPTTQSIQRILLDILAISDEISETPGLTNDIFLLRGKLFSHMLELKEYHLMINGNVKNFEFDDVEEIFNQAIKIQENIYSDKIIFNRTDKKERCEICFLKNSCLDI